MNAEVAEKENIAAPNGGNAAPNAEKANGHDDENGKENQV